MDEPVTSLDSLPSTLEADGERFLPGQMHGSIELEHHHRYIFASQLAVDKVVLDIASGEGYGSAYLAKFARRVIGVDIAKDAVAHANAKYLKDNLEYRVGSCSAIPLEDHSVDLVVSFETIEHHDEHEVMMREIKRVLRPNGILVISSPDKLEYSDKPAFHNPFHIKELYREEFESLLAEHFKNVKLYGQRVMLGSALFGRNGAQDITFQRIGSDTGPVSNVPDPLYWVAVASDEIVPEASGGLFEQPLADLWHEIASQRNARIAELIKAISAPDSDLLKEQLHGSWYLQQNLDIVAAGVDPHEHWFNNGMAEGRLPAADPIQFAQRLVSEREDVKRAMIDEKERELLQARQESIERERAFAAQLTQLQQAANQERAAQVDAAQQQMFGLAEQHARREEALQLAIEEKERELRRGQHESLERQRVLEAEIAQTRLKARYEVDAHLRTLAERERAFGEQVTQLQQTANQERAALVEAAQQQMATLTAQHVQREETLRRAIEEKEREIHSVHQATIERERFFAEQLTQLQQAASQERAAQMEAAQQQMAALAGQHAQREESLRLAIEEKERELRQVQQELIERQRALEAEIAQTRIKARYEVDAQLRTLAERERAFAEQLTQLQQAASQERAAQMEAAQQQLAALAGQHTQREESLRLAIEEKERELRQMQQESLERQKEFTERLFALQKIADQERSALKTQYAGLLFDLNSKLANIQSTWSWRLMAPFRFISGRFGEKADISPIDCSRFSALLAFEGQSSATINPEANAFNRNMSINVRKDTQEMSTHNPSEIITPAKTLDELLTYDGEAFVTCAYLTLLGRAPDPSGFTYYIGRLSKTGDKLAVLNQLYRGVEAKNFNANIAGLKAAMSEYRWSQFPMMKGIYSLFRANEKNAQMLASLRKIERQIAAMQIQAADKIANAKTNGISIDAAATQALFRSFDPQKYLECNPDVAAAGINPFEHFIRNGFSEGRAFNCPGNDEPAEREGALPWSTEESESQDKHALGDNRTNSGARLTAFNKDTGDAKKDIASYFMQSADDALQNDGYTFTRLMHYIWNSRLDLQNAFDIFTQPGRFDFCKWFLTSASVEYGLTPDVYPPDLLYKLSSVCDDVGEKARWMLDEQKNASNQSEFVGEPTAKITDALGANLVGYAFGEFGMGEHVRMVARALNASSTSFCIVDQDVGVHGAGDASVSHWVTDTPEFDINIFHINADVFPPLYFKFGKSFFSGRYNIGYWAWELSKCPSEFDTALNMVDEVWSISDFVTESFNTRSPVPVITMPLAVTVPALDPALYTKTYYGLPEDKFIFFFTFDAASYLDRKNPVAVVRAFRQAFQSGDDNVHLVFKTMNIQVAGPLWNALLEEIDNDPRITIMSKRMTRDEVLGLNLACDAFVSLHRAEGFGRCVAEAMAYGKPVIVTNYSGTRDFAKEETACVVDYQLVPVPDGAYPFWKDQVWADPDIDHAAVLMRKLFSDEEFRTEIALAGQSYVLENFNEKIIGKRYSKHIDKLSKTRPFFVENYAEALQEASHKKDQIVGHIDAPQLNQCNEISDALSVEGWVTSVYGVKSVEIYIDSKFVGETHHGILRPDIYSAFPDMADSARSGFCYQVDITQLPKSNHELLVVAKSRGGETKEWRLEFSLVESRRYEKWLENIEWAYSNQTFGFDPKEQKLFSLLLKVPANLNAEKLTQTLESLDLQKYKKFEIVIIADNSQQQNILSLIQAAGLSDQSHFVLTTANDWEAKVNCCQGQFVGVLDVGDVLRPWALGNVNEAIQKNKQVELVYGDEDQICDGVRCNPIFKPGWSPVFLENYNYIGRPWFVQKSTLISALAGLDLARASPNEHQLLKEIGRISSVVCHIPSVLASCNESLIAERESDAAIDNLPESCGEINYPKVSIIVPTRLSNIDVVERCFAGLVHSTDYPDVEVIVVVNNVVDESLVGRYLANWPFKVVHWTKPFSWSGINNYGVAHATGDYLLFMNDDVEPLEHTWLKSLVQTLAWTNAGVVGAQLKYPNGTIQHLGINFVDHGVMTRHLFRFCSGAEQNLKWLVNYPREVSAVTGACFLTSRECFSALGGFDEELPLVCNDTDFCMRALVRGYSVIVQPGAELIHHEGVSRAGMPEVDDVEKFWVKWETFLKQGDYFTNPNLDSMRDDWVVNPAAQLNFGYRISNRLQEMSHERVQ